MDLETLWKVSYLSTSVKVDVGEGCAEVRLVFSVTDPRTRWPELIYPCLVFRLPISSRADFAEDTADEVRDADVDVTFPYATPAPR